MKIGESSLTNDPRVIGEIVAGSPAEYKALASVMWMGPQDRVWYTATPFVIALRDLEPWERWLAESQYFEGSNDDPSRAYLAAREALRSAPENGHVCLSAGWRAFQLDRIQEAIEFTKRSLKAATSSIKPLALGNLGFFSLCLAFSDGGNAQTHLDAAHQWYEEAIVSCSELPDLERQQVGQLIIQDLREYSEILPDAWGECLASLENALVK